MRKLLATVVCAGLLTTTQAQTVGQIITPTPVSVALTIGQWLMREQKKLYYIEVESRAETFEQAKHEGFRLAVEHAVGSLLLSETEVRNGRLSRDDITTYSSGFVDRFDIVRREDATPGVILTMKVWVAHSAIAGRLLNQSEIAGQVNGEQVHAQVSTITQERYSADRLLSYVLNDFPVRSFDIRLDNTQVQYSQRIPYLVINYDLAWNSAYLDSLAETINSINQNSKCNGMFANCQGKYTQVTVQRSAFGSATRAWFDDTQAWSMFQQEMVISSPHVLVAIKDFDSHIIQQQCYSVPELNQQEWRHRYFVNIGPKEITVNGDLRKRYTVWINLQGINLERLSNVELSVVRRANCP